MKYTSNQKLWRIIHQPEGYYYEIRLAGTVIDRIKITQKVQILTLEGNC